MSEEIEDGAVIEHSVIVDGYRDATAEKAERTMDIENLFKEGGEITDERKTDN